MRYCLCLVLAFLVSCSARPKNKGQEPPKPLDQQQALKNLKSQANQLGRAALEEDHATMAQLTHPVLVEKLGGRARYENKLTSMAREMKDQGFGLKTYSVGEPSELVQASQEVFAVVPCQIELTGPG